MVARVLRFKSSMVAAIRAQFPRRCTSCARPFASISDYLAQTFPLAPPRFDDEDSPAGAVGLVWFANCGCGSTLAIALEDTRLHAEFNQAVRADATAANQSIGAVVEQLMNRVLQDLHTPGPPSEQRADPLMLEIGAAIVEMVRRGTIDLPPYPATALKIRQLASDRRTGIGGLVDLVAIDQGLATTVLRLANSALYRRGDAVTSLATGLTRIGAEELERLALAGALASVANRQGHFAPLRRHFWHRSIITAVVSRCLAELRGCSIDTAFVCGLLHDVGSGIIAANLDAYVARHGPPPPRSFAWWRRVVDYFRAEVGVLAATTWKLPPVISGVMGACRDDEHSAMSATVRQARMIADAMTSKVRLSEETLGASFPGLTRSECAALERTLRECPELIAGLEAPLARVTHEPPPPATRASLRLRSRSEVHVELVRLEEDGLQIRTSAPLLDHYLSCFDCGDDPPFTLWATVVSCVTEHGVSDVKLRPFALDPQGEQRLRALAATLQS